MKKLLLTALWAAACFQGKSQSLVTLKRDMYGIASDATEGRFTASPGYLKAARYVEAQLRASGIRTWLQPVPFSWDDYSGTELLINGKPYPHNAQNFIIVNRGTAHPGKWTVLFPTQEQAKDWETTVIRQYRFGYMHYLPDGRAAAEGAPAVLVSPELAKMLARGDSVEVRLRYRSASKTGYNVIGMLRGTNRAPRGGATIMGAHLDHIGRIGNHIYNGANDDASGCVAELAVARMLAARPPKRTVIFAFFCGEELDLKGSRWFADHLPLPLNDIGLTVNLEQLGSRHRSFKGVWALGNTSYKAAFYKAGTNFTAGDLQFSPTDSVKDVLRNTDSYSFMDKHIPSLLLGSGGFDEHHTPQDKIDLIDFGHLQKASLLLYRFLALSANR